MIKRISCASGAHFLGNCRCIGERGLRHKREDEQLGIKRDWDWYYKIYREDPHSEAFYIVFPEHK